MFECRCTLSPRRPEPRESQCAAVRCSKRAIPAVTETFKDSTLDAMGIEYRYVVSASNSRETPSRSLPIASARRSRAVRIELNGSTASAESAASASPSWRMNSAHSARVVSTTGVANTNPRLARIRRRSHIVRRPLSTSTIPAAPSAQAVRVIAPMLPTIRTPSRMTMSPVLPLSSRSRGGLGARANAKTRGRFCSPNSARVTLSSRT